ncbi:MAG: DUF1080 domain-containing protein [Rhodothermaceae bacterium]|nr:DUF1080 domain-containing protein [Rhodothermaceae bacterium]
MSTRYSLRTHLITTTLTLLFFAPLSLYAQDASDLIGRWNLEVKGEDMSYPSWLEIQKSGNNTLVGHFVGQFGSARPVSEIEYDGSMLRFSIPPQWENRRDHLVFMGQFNENKIKGKTTDEEGNTLTWKGWRAPDLNSHPIEKWSAPVALFNGENVDNWTTQFTDMENSWSVSDGLLKNKGAGNNLISKDTFSDFKLTAEFRYPEGSNGGIYLRGRYELQIEDGFGAEAHSEKIGGIYGFITPSMNASKPAGEWQRMDVELVGRKVTVHLNGERIIDRQTIRGMTGGALDNYEDKPGPIMLQGDHGPLEFRKLEIQVPGE